MQFFKLAVISHGVLAISLNFFFIPVICARLRGSKTVAFILRYPLVMPKLNEVDEDLESL